MELTPRSVCEGCEHKLIRVWSGLLCANTLDHACTHGSPCGVVFVRGIACVRGWRGVNSTVCQRDVVLLRIGVRDAGGMLPRLCHILRHDSALYRGGCLREHHVQRSVQRWVWLESQCQRLQGWCAYDCVGSGPRLVVPDVGAVPLCRWGHCGAHAFTAC